MLQATRALDTKTIAEILSHVHDSEVPLWDYNRESELTAIVNLAYLSARDEYDIQREDRFAVLAQRRMAIEELAATWDTSFDTEEKEEHEEGQS